MIDISKSGSWTLGDRPVHRLGYGAGFYDSLLPDVRPPAQAVVVAFDFQLLVDLPTLPHDVPCDWVVTDTRALKAQP